MKLFIYKTLIVTFAAYFLIQFTAGLKIREYETKIQNLTPKVKVKINKFIF